MVAAFAASIGLCAQADDGEKVPKPNFSSESLSGLDAEIRAYVETQKVSHISYGVWHRGEPVASGFYGAESNGSDQAVSDTTIHRIYSMTKPVTAVGMLILMERGHFELSDPITKILPEFENTEILADYDADGTLFTYSLSPPTIGQLLSHTAGLSYGVKGEGFLEKKLFDTSAMTSPNTDSLVEKVAAIPYRISPGAEWHYSIASDLQGASIERITGESLDVFLTRELFEPLGMTDTGFFVPDEDLGRVSAVTSVRGTELVPAFEPKPDEATQSQIFFEGGQGLFSTQRDYEKFARFLLNLGELDGIRLLGEEPMMQMQANAIRYRGLPAWQAGSGGSAGQGYGFGVGTLEDREIAEMNAPVGTLYWPGALGTWFWIDPENEVVFIGMTQSQTLSGLELTKVSMNSLYAPPKDPKVLVANR